MGRWHIEKWMVGAALAAMVGASTACGTSALGTLQTLSGSGSGSPVVQVAVTPDTLRFTATNQTSQLVATAYDSLGNVVSGTSFTWASSNVGVANVSTDGTVTSEGAGQAIVTASTANAKDSTVVLVSTTGVSPMR